MLEPKDGDFVAYIDALQRESAARLAQQHVNVVDVAFPAKTQANPFGERTGATTVPAGQPAPAHFVRRDRDAKLVRAVVAGVIGAVFLLTWLGSGGPFPFIIGIALLAYALPRLLAAFRTRSAPVANKALIDQVFGRSGTQTTGTGK